MSSSGASEGGGPWVEGGEWAAATGSAAERVAQAPPVDVTQALHQARWLEALSEQALEAREDLVTLAQRLGEPGPRTGRAELMALAEVARESADAVGFALVGAGQTARRSLTRRWIGRRGSPGPPRFKGLASRAAAIATVAAG